jgi:hypothetical protein
MGQQQEGEWARRRGLFYEWKKRYYSPFAQFRNYAAAINNRGLIHEMI